MLGEKKSGTADEGAAPYSFPRKAPLVAPSPALSPAPRIFLAILPAPSPAIFWFSPFLYSVAGRPGCKSKPLKVVTSKHLNQRNLIKIPQKSSANKRVVLSKGGFPLRFLVPSFRFFVPSVRFLYPRSGFGGSWEHPPKPPLWQPRFKVANLRKTRETNHPKKHHAVPKHRAGAMLFPFEAAPRPSLFRGVHQFVWNHLESVSRHFAEQLQPLSTKHSRVVTRQFSKKLPPQLADPRNGAVFEPTNH